MRIPIYRAKSQLSNQAPGARITARMNATPFVNAELQKGGVLTTALGEAAEYTNMRYKMLVETQKNEAIFAAKEQLMQLSDTLSDSRDIGNIFDGELKYQKGVDEIKKTLRQSVGQNKYALADFDNSFAQAEIPIRFRLKEVIDLKIDQRRQAALTAREAQTVQTLSNPFLDYTSDDLAMELAQLETAYDQAEMNGGASRTSIELNGIPVNQRVLLAAAKQLMPAYAGSDIDTASQLYEAFLQIQKVRSSEITAEEMKVSGTIPGHVLNVLQTIPADQANEILLSTIADATKVFNLQETLEDEVLETQNRLNTKAYNFALGVHNGEPVTKEIMAQILNASDLARFEDQYPEGAAGLEVKRFINDRLGARGQFWLNREQQDQLAKELDVNTNVIFAAPGEGSAAEYSRLYATAQAGMLTTSELNNSRPQLEASQHRDLVQLMQSESDEALGEADNDIKLAFKYNELLAIGKDDNLAKASKSAYEKASRELLRETSKRQIAQNPMTREEMFAFAQKQIDQFMVGYTAALRVEYNEYLEQQINDFTLGFRIDPNDPINSVQSWYDNLDQTQQQQALDKLVIFKAAIRSRFSGTGLFNE
tara:strand:+ start:1265 stop:3049 length:1785 start_codon:yes stop_codon:yes gene_type:complete